MAAKAALLGANMVAFPSWLTVLTRLAWPRAPARAVRPAAAAVSAGFSGMVRTLSTIWTTPPVKMLFCHFVSMYFLLIIKFIGFSKLSGSVSLLIFERKSQEIKSVTYRSQNR